MRNGDTLAYLAWKLQDVHSGPAKVLSAIWEMWNEVHCDGFAFYLVNDSESVPIIVASLVEIGAHQTMDICSRAINVAFPEGIPEEFPTDPHEFSEEVGNKLHELDQEFYKHPDDVEDLLFQYVQNHPEVFGSVDSVMKEAATSTFRN